MRANHRMQRLFIPEPLSADQLLALKAEHAHYLLHVLRMKQGNEILVFNGQDGEWRAELVQTAKKNAAICITRKERPQSAAPDLVYCFAPLKHARLDYMVQKAVEMGAGVLQPVMTRHTQATRLNLERMRANIIEAAEQCGILALPECRVPVPFHTLLETWETQRRLIFCDETAEGNNPLSLLNPLKHAPLGLLIGPEGGFADDERAALRTFDFVTAISLGPRILRADTAAVAALAIINATLGNWA